MLPETSPITTEHRWRTVCALSACRVFICLFPESRSDPQQTTLMIWKNLLALASYLHWPCRLLARGLAELTMLCVFIKPGCQTPTWLPVTCLKIAHMAHKSKKCFLASGFASTAPYKQTCAMHRHYNDMMKTEVTFVGSESF